MPSTYSAPRTGRLRPQPPFGNDSGQNGAVADYFPDAPPLSELAGVQSAALDETRSMLKHFQFPQLDAYHCSGFLKGEDLVLRLPRKDGHVHLYLTVSANAKIEAPATVSVVLDSAPLFHSHEQAGDAVAVLSAFMNGEFTVEVMRWRNHLARAEVRDAEGEVRETFGPLWGPLLTRLRGLTTEAIDISYRESKTVSS